MDFLKNELRDTLRNSLKRHTVVCFCEDFVEDIVYHFSRAFFHEDLGVRVPLSAL